RRERRLELEKFRKRAEAAFPPLIKEIIHLALQVVQVLIGGKMQVGVVVPGDNLLPDFGRHFAGHSAYSQSNPKVMSIRSSHLCGSELDFLQALLSPVTRKANQKQQQNKPGKQLIPALGLESRRKLEQISEKPLSHLLSLACALTAAFRAR